MLPGQMLLNLGDLKPFRFHFRLHLLDGHFVLFSYRHRGILFAEFKQHQAPNATAKLAIKIRIVVICMK